MGLLLVVFIVYLCALCYGIYRVYLWGVGGIVFSCAVLVFVGSKGIVLLCALGLNCVVYGLMIH